MSNECNVCPAQPVKPSGCCGCDDCRPYSTKYYHLPLWRANDVTSWLVGINKAMVDIDQLFHDFALRTGIEGVPDDVVTTVQQLQASVDCLEDFRRSTIEDLAATTKVVSDALGSIDLVNEKLRGLGFAQSNTEVRIKGIEQELSDIKDNITTLFSRVEKLDASVEENTESIGNLNEQLASEVTRLESLITGLTTRIEVIENNSAKSTTDPIQTS